MPDTSPREIGFGNYLVAFLDLLGQRDAMRGQGLLPVLQSDSDREAFTRIAIASIGAVVMLQKTSEEIFRGYERHNITHLAKLLPVDAQGLLQDLNAGKISTQRWSDGLMHYYSMRGSNILRDLSAYYALIARTGSNALIGLARGQPIRGGIEVSWGVELHENELYGPAVANAYALESSIAQYPRIVIGPFAMDYLVHLSANTESALDMRVARVFAMSILDMTFRDHDGAHCVHYLAPEFVKDPDSPHVELFPRAMSFVESQLTKHRSCPKLFRRYQQLHAYLLTHAP